VAIPTATATAAAQTDTTITVYDRARTAELLPFSAVIDTLAAVNDALSKLEQSGELQGIFDKWFGPNTTYQVQRSFKVEPING